MTETRTVQLTLTTEELQLVRTALGFLVSTLGREEAEELAAVQSIIDHIDAAAD